MARAVEQLDFISGRVRYALKAHHDGFMHLVIGEARDCRLCQAENCRRRYGPVAWDELAAGTRGLSPYPVTSRRQVIVDADASIQITTGCDGRADGGLVCGDELRAEAGGA